MKLKIIHHLNRPTDYEYKKQYIPWSVCVSILRVVLLRGKGARCPSGGVIPWRNCKKKH